MKKICLYSAIILSFLINLCIGINLLSRWTEKVDYNQMYNGRWQSAMDYNKIYVGTIIEEPNIAENVADIYFEKFLKDRKAFDKRDQFTTTVMIDKDTCEWVVVYFPVLDMSMLQLSSGPADYPHEVRLRKDHGMVRIEGYDFCYYLY